MQRPPETSIGNLVHRLWSLCHVLRDDGITYHQYVIELSYLLFLKLAAETGAERGLPEAGRWARLRESASLSDYQGLLDVLGNGAPGTARDIFAGARTALRQDRSLHALVAALDGEAWFGTQRESLGELYEGILERNAGELKSGAGQYFTPRPLVECMTRLIAVEPAELLVDPACGTGGFLVAAARAADGARRPRAVGVELVPDTRRLALMNLMLHGIDGEIRLGDALSPLGSALPAADVILTNPPFGNKRGGGRPTRSDLRFPTSNKQLAFIEACYHGLRPGGRCAVVVPDNVLFEEGVGQRLRGFLLDRCDLHTILRLPTGIFYAPGIKTNVLFFTRAGDGVPATERVWFYDLRTHTPRLGKRSPLSRQHFAEFERCYGGCRFGRGHRVDEGPAGRFRPFSREALRERQDNLDVTWLDGGEAPEDPPDLTALAQEIRRQLHGATQELDALVRRLGAEA